MAPQEETPRRPSRREIRTGDRSNFPRDLEAPLARSELEEAETSSAAPGRSGKLRRLFGRLTPAKTAVLQGGYYALTGLWPFVSMSTFLLVTGPKTDLWLVRTVGGLLAILGGVLLLSGVRRRVTFGMRILGIAVAGFLAASDLFYVAAGQVPPVFLADAVVEGGLLAAWLAARNRKD